MNYYRIPPERLEEGGRLCRFPSSDAVFQQLAHEMVETILENEAAGEPTVLILPVGPIGQYPFFVDEVNRRQLSLKNCWFFNMDEYLGEDGGWIAEDSPLSFRGFMDRTVYSRLSPGLSPPPEQRIFPRPEAPEAADALLAQLGGADICFGGIGLNGHLAFNEAQPELTAEVFSALPSRVVTLSPETRASNAIGELGGALECMPEKAVTLGMRSILGARKIRLGVFRPWHRGVCRRAAFGVPTAAFPATLVQQHPDVKIYVNDVAAQLPW